MKDMKKYIVALVMIVALLVPCQMKAQVFLDDEDLYNSRVTTSEWDGGLIVPYQGGDHDEFVPIGSELLTLLGLGGAYLLVKRRKDHEDGK